MTISRRLVFCWLGILVSCLRWFEEVCVFISDFVARIALCFRGTHESAGRLVSPPTYLLTELRVYVLIAHRLFEKVADIHCELYFIPTATIAQSNPINECKDNLLRLVYCVPQPFYSNKWQTLLGITGREVQPTYEAVGRILIGKIVHGVLGFMCRALLDPTEPPSLFYICCCRSHPNSTRMPCGESLRW